MAPTRHRFRPYRFLHKQWFLLSLALVLTIGMTFAPALETLGRATWLKWTIVSITMFMIVWPFSFGDVKATAKNPKAALLASCINAVVMPLAIWPFVILIGGDIGHAMAVAFAAPCTVAAAAVWTRRAGGDDRVAVFVTLLTNMFCFAIAPFWLWLQTSSDQPVSVGFSGVALKLLMFVVLPMVVAQLIRLHDGSAVWATDHKKGLGIASQIGLLSIVLLGAIQSGLRFRQSELSFPLVELVLGVICLLGVHVFVLYFAKWIASQLNLKYEEQIAVAFGGSQKTLMVGVSIAVSVHATILPLLAFHSLQLLIDTMIADRFVAAKKKLES